MNPVKNLAALSISTAALSLVATGCGGGQANTQPAKVADANCATVPIPTTPTTPTVAVLTQLGPATNEIAAARAQSLKLVVAGSTDMKAHFMLNSVGAGIGAPNLVVNTTLVAEGENDLFRDSNLNCKHDAINSEYEMFKKAATPKELDVFAALRTLKRDLEGVPHGTLHVVLLSSLLSTQPIDLTKDAVLSDPVRSINTLADKRQNFTCVGWRVYAIGGSFRNNKAVSGPKDIALRQWWTTYFKRCGGVLVTYNTELAKFPLGARGVEGIDTRKIPLERHPNVVIATLNSKVLFAVNSAQLQPGADEQLVQLLPLIADAKGPIDIDGHTDNSGSDAINKPLSKARAGAVARWIATRTRLSSGRLSVRGYGSSKPTASNATSGGRAENRRVVVTIHAK